jgi:hypothetical protein
MLETRKMVVSLEGADLVELEGIIMDGDEKEALRFLKKTIYDRVVQEQQGRLKSHLDGGKAAEGFARGNK